MYTKLLKVKVNMTTGYPPLWSHEHGTHLGHTHGLQALSANITSCKGRSTKSERGVFTLCSLLWEAPQAKSHTVRTGVRQHNQLLKYMKK